jgi:hypothetical protein
MRAASRGKMAAASICWSLCSSFDASKEDSQRLLLGRSCCLLLLARVASRMLTLCKSSDWLEFHFSVAQLTTDCLSICVSSSSWLAPAVVPQSLLTHDVMHAKTYTLLSILLHSKTMHNCCVGSSLEARFE